MFFVMFSHANGQSVLIFQCKILANKMLHMPSGSLGISRENDNVILFSHAFCILSGLTFQPSSSIPISPPLPITSKTYITTITQIAIRVSLRKDYVCLVKGGWELFHTDSNPWRVSKNNCHCLYPTGDQQLSLKRDQIGLFFAYVHHFSYSFFWEFEAIQFDFFWLKCSHRSKKHVRVMNWVKLE